MAVQAIIIKTVKFPVLNELLGSLYVDIACVAESIDLFSSSLTLFGSRLLIAPLYQVIIQNIREPFCQTASQKLYAEYLTDHCHQA